MWPRWESPRYSHVKLVSRYPVLTAVNWSRHWCAICVQYQYSYAPKRARRCEIEHRFIIPEVLKDGRCTVSWLPNFLGWVDLLTHGAPLQTVITFKILKSHKGFCISSITDDLSFRLFGLELSARSQTSELSFLTMVIFGLSLQGNYLGSYFA